MFIETLLQKKGTYLTIKSKQPYYMSHLEPVIKYVHIVPVLLIIKPPYQTLGSSSFHKMNVENMMIVD